MQQLNKKKTFASEIKKHDDGNNNNNNNNNNKAYLKQHQTHRTTK
jgi:hypothetical protein